MPRSAESEVVSPAVVQGAADRRVGREPGGHRAPAAIAGSRRPKGAEQWIAMPVPPIVAGQQFRQVQALLAARNRHCLPPRVVGSPVRPARPR